MRSRIYQPEIMDEETPRAGDGRRDLPVPDVGQSLTSVASVARSRGSKPFSRTWRAGERIEVLEIACGAADVPRALIAWGRSRGFDLRVTATDILPSRARLRATRAAPSDERLRLVAADVDAAAVPGRGVRLRDVRALLPPPDRRPDHRRPRNPSIASPHAASSSTTSSDRDARSSGRGSSRGRSTRSFTTTARLSIRRALKPAEMQHLATAAGLPWLTVQRHFGHRMTLAGQKRQGN